MLTQRRIDRQTDRHTERQTHRETDRGTVRQCKQKYRKHKQCGNRKQQKWRRTTCEHGARWRWKLLHFTHFHIWKYFLQVFITTPKSSRYPSTQYPVPSLPPYPLWSSSGIAALKTFMGFVFARHVCILYMRYVWKSTFLSFLRCSGFGFDSARLCAEFGGINGEWVSW